MLQTDRAGEILEQYAGNTVEDMMSGFVNFCARVLNFTPYPHQLFYALECFRNPYVLCVAPPRSGKTNGIEAVDLYETACYPHEDGVIYAPKFDQARDSLSYQYNWIEQSPLLKQFLKRKNGKPMFSSEGFTFRNMSNWRIYSILGKIEGHNVTIMRPEEFDDWPWETFSNDVMRRGGAKPRNGKQKRIRITGTIMGKENIYRIENDPDFAALFKNLSWMGKTRLDIYYMLEADVMDPQFVKIQKTAMSPDEWARSGLLLYTESTNFIWSAYLRKAMKIAMAWGLTGIDYVKGGKYESPLSRVVHGLDCGHAGSGQNASRYALQFIEEISAGTEVYRRWIAGFEYDPKTDTDFMAKDMADKIEFYSSVGGYSDALNPTLARAVNKECFNRGITDKNPDDFPDNTQSHWDEWFTTPMWNSDKNKHFMYQSLQQSIHNFKFFFPYYDTKDNSYTALRCANAKAQILNIRQVASNGTYPSYQRSDPKIGDDDADALGMAVKWLDDNPHGFCDFRNFKASGHTRDHVSRSRDFSTRRAS